MPSPFSVSLPLLPSPYTYRHTHTHKTQPIPAKALHGGRCFPAERSPEGRAVCQAVPELAFGTAFWGQSTFEPEATFAWAQTPRASSPRLSRLAHHWRVADEMAAAPGLAGGHPWWLPSPEGHEKGDLALAKAHEWARLRPVDLNDVLDGPPADGAAGAGLPLEPQAAAVAQAHMSTRVDDGVHLTVEAHRALAVLAACRLRCREHGGHRGAQRGAGGCHQG